MSVTSVREIWNGREGDEDREGIRNYTRIFRVLTNDNADTAYTVKASGSLPSVGDAHNEDLTSWCISVRARNEGFSPRVWIVTCMYSSDFETTDNPLNEPARIEWDSEQFQEPAHKDRDGKGVVNSAGDPFDPPVLKDNSRRTVQITANVASVPTWVLSMEDTINDASVDIDGFTAAAETVKVNKIRISQEKERNGTAYREITIILHLNKNTWVHSELDQGFRELNASGDLIQIKNPGDDAEVTAPVLLDGYGSQLQNPGFDTAVFLDFDLYEATDLTVLPGVSAP